MQRFVGGHVSAEGGLSKAIQRAKEIGADTIQIFGTSPYSWAVAKHSAKEIKEFKKAVKEARMGPVFLHAPYIVNLASPDIVLRKRSELSLEGNLKIAEQIGAKGVIFHIGSSKGAPKENGRAQVVQSVKAILKHVSGKSLLVLENSAGGGDSVGSTLEDIGHMIKEIGSPRAGMCFDTAHAFEAGMIENYTQKSVAEFVLRLKRTIGLTRLAVLHINDSKTAFDSRHDRHENIGEGYIGKEGFRALAGHEDLCKVPWILEVPGFNGEGPDKKNIDIIKRITIS